MDSSRRGRTPRRRARRASPTHALLLAAALLAGCEPDRLPSPAATPRLEPALRGAPRPAGGMPTRLAIAGSGRVILASDPQSNRILQVDAATLVAVAAAPTRGKPLAIGLGGGRIFVGNVTAQTIDVVHRNGRFARSFGHGSVGYPADLDVDQDRGLLFVLDGFAHAVKVFTFDGALLQTIGAPGALPAPVAVGVDTARQEVLVSDYGNPDAGLPAAVKIYDYAGRYVAEISGRGRCGSLGCSGGFSRPQGLTVEGGRIFLTDAVLAAVLVFDRATLGQLATLGGRGVGPAYLRLPTDVVIGRDGDVFVASSLSGGVAAFRGAAAAP